ncbi:MAG: cell division protein ZapA [Bacteroidales bacterium]|nr:cell division protein ZapA [Bacteroidales bacterium]
MDEIQLNITIMEKAYRITVARADEEKVRKAVAMINEMVKSYARHYTFKDVQDILAMTALHFATSAVKYESELSYDSQHLERKLNELNDLLDEQL